jgi:hypothetical protein
VPLEAHVLGDLETRDDTPLDLLARFPGCFARSPILPPGLIEVGNKSVVLETEIPANLADSDQLRRLREGQPKECKESARSKNLLLLVISYCRNSLIANGASRRTRTYNQEIKSLLLYH